MLISHSQQRDYNHWVCKRGHEVSIEFSECDVCELFDSVQKGIYTHTCEFCLGYKRSKYKKTCSAQCGYAIRKKNILFLVVQKPKRGISIMGITKWFPPTFILLLFML